MKLIKSIKMLTILSSVLLLAACGGESKEFKVFANGTVKDGDVKTVSTFKDNVATFEFQIENPGDQDKNISMTETRKFDSAKFQTKVNGVAGDNQGSQKWDITVAAGQTKTVTLQLVIPADQKESVSCPVELTLEDKDPVKVLGFTVKFDYTYNEPDPGVEPGEFRMFMTKGEQDIESGAKLECSSFELDMTKTNYEAVFDFSIENLSDESYPYTMKEIRNFDNTKYKTQVCITTCGTGNTEKEEVWEVGVLDIKPRTVQVHVLVPASETEAVSLPMTLEISNGVKTKTFDVTYVFDPYVFTAPFIVRNEHNNRIIKKGDVIEYSEFATDFGSPEAVFDMSFTNTSSEAVTFSIIEKRDFDTSKYGTSMCVNECMMGTKDKEQTWAGVELQSGETKEGIAHHLTILSDNDKAAECPVEFTFSDGTNTLTFTVKYKYTPSAE